MGRYRWVGAGDQLINSGGTGLQPFADGSNAFEVLTGGRYQEWQLGMQLNIPIGFRRAMTGVRQHQLLLARERAVLDDIELEVSHQLTDAVRDVDLNYGLTVSNFNRRVAAEDEVEAIEAIVYSGRFTIDVLLDAQRRRAEAESAYYRSLADYNRAIMQVHFRKGSLLEYNGVYLAEGPWPGKAYFDALRRARKRDASRQLDYGFTRPDVISRGPIDQNANGGQRPAMEGPIIEDSATETPVIEEPTPLLHDGSQADDLSSINRRQSISDDQSTTSRRLGGFFSVRREQLPFENPLRVDNTSLLPASFQTTLSPYPTTGETQTNHAIAEVATDPASGQGAGR